ncbi:sulfotransferase family protein [Rhodovulum adriaticum]|uniref:Sulfotransferase domain-containing protein n=1 Tax=Rhodovulum adriaticum TaxID=35804 RepID=A0A4R2NYQ2_RHOAD|nr:sulfotransferase [Rhodovulum adriaticum]MBK1634202.1 hypothetical protein [Rhodovulum adriaticum]TCP27247.1 sulfotransferase domain-containing protein [Rhodovulum adriaticum]
MNVPDPASVDYLCNLLIPGAPKSGTSTLHAALATHPHICMSRPKEPWLFFRADSGVERHNALFAHAQADARVFGESSQGYFADAPSMDRIAACLKRPRIILLLRHPVDRALSQYRYDLRRGIETDPLDVALRNRGEDSSYVYDTRISFYRSVGGYLAFSRYARIVPEWQRRFGGENVLLLRAEDFHATPAAVLARCHRFLGLTPLEQAPPPARNATTGTQRKVMPGPIRAAARLVPGGLKSSALYRRLRGSVLQGITPAMPDAPDEASLRLLRDALQEDIAFHAGLSSTAD